ncbi:MAG: cephalosporin hydroxylase [Actinobacteria bacterium]|nr:cephalosporin hydroxylase [Actinomycetota bacterium]
MSPEDLFAEERRERIRDFATEPTLNKLSHEWVFHSMQQKYLYNFDWLGRPIIQYPEDMVAVQELVWLVRPTLIIETGIAHGGSLVLSASMLALLDYCEAVENGQVLDPKKTSRRVIGVDIDIRSHNRRAIENHPLSHMISMVEGSSVERGTVDAVRRLAQGHECVMVFLDSNHTHAHVLQELKDYGTMASVGSYCVVFDTFVEDMPPKYFPDRPWDKGNSPKTAVHEFVSEDDRFVIDRAIDQKLLITVAPSGYLKRVK